MLAMLQSLSLAFLLLPLSLLAYRDIDEPALLGLGADGNSAQPSAVAADSKLQTEEAADSAALSAACMQILQAVHQHVADLAAPAEKDFVRRTSMVSGLERHGVPLEKQVQWFALTQLGMITPDLEEEDSVAELGHDQEDVGEDAEIEDTTTPVVETTAQDKEMGMDKKIVGPDRIDEAKTVENEDEADPEEEGESEVHEESKSDASDRLQAFLKSTSDSVDESAVKSFNDAYAALAKLARENARIIPGNKPLSQVDPMKYRASQLIKRGKEYKKWAGEMAEAVKPYLSKGVENSKLTKEEKVKKLLEVNDGLQTFRNRISDMHTSVRAKRDVDWFSVKKYTKKGRFVRFLGWVKKQVVSWATGLKKIAKRIWRAFVSSAQDAEEKCVEEHKKREKKAMKEEGMRDSEEMAKAMVNADEGKATKVLDEEMGKADAAISKGEQRSGAKEGELAKQAADLKKAGEIIEKDANTGNLSETDVDELSKNLGEVSDTACEAKEWSLTDSLKELWKKAKRTEGRLAPQIGFRGIGGAVSVLGGGVEEVLDFWNKEIGLFTWGSASIGMSSGSVGVSGYAGMGWKGYKVDWNLQEAYQTSKYTAVGVSASFPIPVASFAFSGVLALDADASTLPWVVDEPGLHGIAIGWGLSMGLSFPVPFSVDVGMATYNMFHSECYDSLSSFLGAIWLPHCRNCTGFAHKATVLGVRSAIKAGSFPILADIVMSYLAWRAHSARTSHNFNICTNRSRFRPCLDGTYNPDYLETFRCSPISTKFTHSFVHMSRLVVSQIEGLVIQLVRLQTEFERLMTSIERALAAGNQEVFVSKDWLELFETFEGEEVGCPSAPAEKTENLAPGKAIVPGLQEQTEEFLKTKSEDELKKMCKSIARCKDRTGWGLFYDKEDRIKDLLDTYREVSEENPWGACTQTKQCKKGTSSDKKCDCTNVKHGMFQNVKKLFQDCPSMTGRCACGPGTCWAKGKGCVPGKLSVADRSGVTKLRASFKEWLFARHIELGSYAVRFQELAVK